MTTNNAINAPEPFVVGNGGTGAASFTAYSVLCAGTTATGVFQNVSGVGTAGQALTSNGSSALPTWQALGGSMFQTQSTSLTTTFSTSSTSYTDLTGLSVTITPISSSNVIYVWGYVCGTSTAGMALRLLRGSTAIGIGTSVGSRTAATSSITSQAANTQMFCAPFDFLDSPATTSATTYKLQVLVPSGTGYVNFTSADTNSSTFKRSISTIVVMEIT